MSIGKRITELRSTAKLSLEYIAEKLGVSRQAVSKWENNISSPDTKNLIALADLLGVSVEYLATGKESAGISVKERDRSGVFYKLSSVFFLFALISYCIGMFSGEFSRALLPPFLYYGKSVQAVVLMVFTVIFTVGWISILVMAIHFDESFSSKHK